MAESFTVQVRGGMFSIKLFTQGIGHNLVFLHGAGGLFEWPSWLDPVSERFRVIAPQHPGFGASTGLEHLDNFQDLALYYLDFFDQMGLRRPHLIGHSFGGNIAAEIAAINPERVGNLVLVGALGLWKDDTPVPDIFAMTRSELERARWHDAEAARARGWSVEPKDDAERQQIQLDLAQSFSAAGKFLWPIPDKGLKKRLHRISAPTLILWGASDAIVPPVYGRMFAEGIRGSRVVMLPDAGHLPMVEQEEAFSATVMGFLGGG